MHAAAPPGAAIAPRARAAVPELVAAVCILAAVHLHAAVKDTQAHARRVLRAPRQVVRSGAHARGAVAGTRGTHAHPVDVQQVVHVQPHSGHVAAQGGPPCAARSRAAATQRRALRTRDEVNSTPRHQTLVCAAARSGGAAG